LATKREKKREKEWSKGEKTKLVSLLVLEVEDLRVDCLNINLIPDDIVVALDRVDNTVV